MTFNATKDFNHPRGAVLARVRDPRRFEAALADLGVHHDLVADAPPLTWNCQLEWRGQRRRFTATLQESAPETRVAITLRSDLAQGDITLDFHDLSQGACRVVARADLRARTLMAKAALHALHLARERTEKRLCRVVTVLGRP